MLKSSQKQLKIGNKNDNVTLRILIVGYSRLRIVLDNNVSDNSFIIGNISRHYRQNRIIGRRLRGGTFLQAVTRSFLVTWLKLGKLFSFCDFDHLGVKVLPFLKILNACLLYHWQRLDQVWIEQASSSGGKDFNWGPCRHTVRCP